MSSFSYFMYSGKFFTNSEFAYEANPISLPAGQTLLLGSYINCKHPCEYIVPNDTPSLLSRGTGYFIHFL